MMFAPLLLFLALPSWGATLNVCSTCTYTTIGDAVDAASSGDTIAVAAGSYGESGIDVSVDLDIVGAGSGTTSLVSRSTGISFDGVDATLSGISVTTRQRALDVDASTLELDDVEISGAATTSDGAGMRIRHSSTVTVTDCDFSGNEAEGASGGHISVDDSVLEISDSTFAIGWAELGGGIAADDSTVTITDSEFTSHEAESDSVVPQGGSIYVDDTTLSLDGCTLEMGTVEGGHGGHIAARSSTVELVDTELSDGEVTYYGGAIYGDSTDLSLDGADLHDNQTTSEDYGYGGAINLTQGSLTDSGSLLEYNAAPLGGGAVFLNQADGTLVGTSFLENEAQYSGGALYSYAADLVVTDASFTDNASTSGYGGGLVWVGEDGGSETLLLDGCTFEDNEAYAGGGVALAYGASASVDACSFDANSAYRGGGLFALELPELAIGDTDLADNEATYDGGAVGTQEVGDAEVEWSTFCANTSSYGDGGGWHSGVDDTAPSTGLTASLAHVALVENTADGSGGGAYFASGVVASVVNDVFLTNEADTAGAAVYLEDSDGAAVQNNIFAHNATATAVDAGDDFSGGTFDYNLYWDNDDDMGVRSGGHDTEADPLLELYTADGDCSSDKLTTECESPVLDAGDPAILDPDGSASDIGLYGGPDAPARYFVDSDDDGYYGWCDCDDTDADVNPGGTEVPYDGKDNDCEDGDACDLDGDGHDYDGCADGTDCDDSNGSVNPDATERWYDGVDADCDGWSDFDQDRDGHDADGYGGDDCHDLDDEVHPGAEEICYDGLDNDCDGGDQLDCDGDGYDADFAGGEDCDDSERAVHPGAEEVPYDGLDNDCSGGDLVDVDGDGWDGEQAGGEDCDDDDPDIHPGAEDALGDGIDSDCDGADGDNPDDTDEPDSGDPDDTDDLKPGGCGCDGGGGPGAWWALALGVLALRRRRLS